MLTASSGSHSGTARVRKRIFVSLDIFGIKILRLKRVIYDQFEIATKLCKS